MKKGRCKQTQRDFAIKIIEKDKCSELELQQFVAEIDILQDLSHPNIIQLVAHFDEVEHFSMVFEIMSGGDLFNRLVHVGTFDEIQARGICTSMLNAISYIHSKNIAHRDIKPENILFSSYNENHVLKICDFGFAKQENVHKPDSFTTMCGTRSYIAPEIMLSQRYGLKVDMWSIGIVAYMLLCGYEPFHCKNDDHVPQLVVTGSFSFEDKYWKGISDSAKDFIASLLQVDPCKRLSAKEAQQCQWFSKRLIGRDENSSQVFFMIGSQRSGSNWLRTLIDEREDIAAPHPPHIVRDFMPILEKYGELSLDSNYQVLVDHVCTFVERNQVPWTDRHGRKLLLTRKDIFERALRTCDRLRKNNRSPSSVDAPVVLPNGLYLLAVFDAIMSFYAAINGKRVWLCKSMGMSYYHDILLEFYGEGRLRYIYLVRDPRDVAMSFIKT